MNLNAVNVELTSHSTSISSQLKSLAPWASSVVAFLALVAALIQYFRDQRRQRNLRIEERVSDNLDKLARFSVDATIPLATPISALYSLQVLVELSTVQKTYQNQITNVIAAAVREDLDFTVTNHVRFDQVCLAEWKPYAAQQELAPADNMLIISRYLSALRTAASDSPGLMRHVKIVNNEIAGTPQAATYSQLSHLVHLIEGYVCRSSLLPVNLQQEVDIRFMQSTGNSNLTDYVKSRRSTQDDSLPVLLAKMK